LATAGNAAKLVRVRWVAKASLIVAIGLMLPGSVELAQDALHLAIEGHTVHEDEHSHGDGNEHGCSGPYHACGCCASATFVTAPAAPELFGGLPVTVPELTALATPVPSAHVDRLLRPPAA
jgi:hypothetical protein